MGTFYYDKKGYVRYVDSGELVHRKIAAKMIGRELEPWEDVHHKDGDTTNFRKSNLKVMDLDRHEQIHTKKRRSSWW